MTPNLTDGNQPCKEKRARVFRQTSWPGLGLLPELKEAKVPEA